MPIFQPPNPRLNLPSKAFGTKKKVREQFITTIKDNFKISANRHHAIIYLLIAILFDKSHLKLQGG